VGDWRAIFVRDGNGILVLHVGHRSRIYDDDQRVMHYVRVPYDVELAARKIRKAGLPEFLAARLTMGM
jgi:hypothetical protein